MSAVCSADHLPGVADPLLRVVLPRSTSRRCFFLDTCLQTMNEELSGLLRHMVECKLFLICKSREARLQKHTLLPAFLGLFCCANT